jgi:hypothetical protein
MNEEQVRASLSSEVCAACGGVKTANAAFCRTDFAALTIWQRGQLAEGLAHPDFVDVFRAALRHLQLNPQRARRLPGNSSEWRHATPEDLLHAAISFHGYGQCRAPRCLARIAWWKTPSGRLMPVNPVDCQPHRSSCRQREYFEPIAQTSARKGRR